MLLENHDVHSVADDGHDLIIVWKGVVVLLCSFSFFFIERLMNIFGEWRQRIHSEKQVHYSYSSGLMNYLFY